MNFNNKNFIIHIGLHKTGSTFIQKHLNLIQDKNYKLFILDEFCELLVDYLEDPNEIKKIIYTILLIAQKKMRLLSLQKEYLGIITMAL